MNTGALKKFAQAARRQLREQVAGRLEQVLNTDSAELRERESALKELREQIARTSKEAVIDRTAYTWFNRFCALRFMDVNRYTRMGVVSPAEGLTQPEILQEAKRGYIDDDLKGFVDAKVVFDLLNGQRSSADPQGEAYRLLLVGACNFYNTAMSFLFEKIADYTELLMPFDLLSEHAVLHDLRQALTTEACQDEEVIGWLYQYYISERKDEVFEALKQNQKIEAADIPAATQLFTPHWIVRYLVENSLGRLWMLNHPNSRLRENMEYYIAPTQQDTDFLKVSNPEELRICDPACGSGHMLTYAFDLLYAIYEEAGYPTADIARLILEKNLYGIEIDPRAGALAAFALTMKACAKDRRFLSHSIQPNICVLENLTFTDQELDEYMRVVGRDLFTAPLLETLKQFEQADNFGTLIRPALTDAAFVRGLLEARNLGGDIFLYNVHQRVHKVLKQAEYLAPRYHVVVANPPYMGSRGMNDELKIFARDQYPDSKPDLFAMFIERNINLVIKHGFVGMITMQSWMFLSSLEKLRKRILREKTILSMAHLGARAFDSIGGEVVSTTAFILKNDKGSLYKGTYLRLISGGNEAEKESLLRENVPSHLSLQPIFYFKACATDFNKIPGSPIAYWVSERVRELFLIFPFLSEYNKPLIGMRTGDNERFLRLWHEVELSKTSLISRNNPKWFPYTKGGEFRRWFGNNEYLVNWENNGYEIKENTLRNYPELSWDNLGWKISNEENYFMKAISWTCVCASLFSARYILDGSLFDTGGSFITFRDNIDNFAIIGFLNSKIAQEFLFLINPTINYGSGTVAKLPFPPRGLKYKSQIVDDLISISQRDWDSHETSWGFTDLPLLRDKFRIMNMSYSYKKLRAHWKTDTEKMQHLEAENNSFYIEAYSLKNELTPEVLLEEITLTCNPYYRCGGNKSDEELEALLCADTMKKFISYAVGCIFGRYSLDKPGLVLANQGETLQDYLRQVPEPSFMPDEDNAIPVLDGEWFSDDMPSRFKQFLRLTFGDEGYAENLAFIEEAIGRDIRSYFVKEFYKDHVQMYKKRPIYWMFSSPKGSFNVLIYMHRYKPDAISIILNNYLRQYREKLNAHRSYQEAIGRNPVASQSERTKSLREIDWVNKVLAELKEYENEILYPLATEQIKIDLDDGVKVNYGKFGKALKPISGL